MERNRWRLVAPSAASPTDIIDRAMETTTMILDLVGRIGESDCETLGDGLFAQPVNTATSLAYVLVGGVIVASTATSRVTNRSRSIVFGTCVAAIGLGSVMFHGLQTSGSQVMHDLPILITMLFVANHDVWLGQSKPRGELVSFAVLALLSSMISAIEVQVVAGLTAVALGCAAVAEFWVFRRGLRTFERSLQRRSYLAIVAVSAVAGASWLLGRTDGPVCDPESVLQPHGLWHVISAAVFGIWWWLALTTHPPSGQATSDGADGPDLASTISPRDDGAASIET